MTDDFSQICLAAISANKDDIKVSSSGAIFPLIARQIIQDGGIVYGCALTKGSKVQHIRISNINEIKQLQGSKYVQSDTAEALKQARTDLANGITVLFSGTPCQIRAVKTIAPTNSHLITIDLVCHGVPSQKYFETCLRAELPKKETIKNIIFRDKKFGWGCSGTIKTETKSRIFNPYTSFFYDSFLKGAPYRESCYNCPYASTKRLGDITLGDFWGISKTETKLEGVNDGVSLLIINTPLGKSVFKKISANLVFEQHALNEATSHNEQLLSPSEKPDLRHEIFTNIDNGTLDKMTKKHVISNAFNIFRWLFGQLIYRLKRRS